MNGVRSTLILATILPFSAFAGSERDLVYRLLRGELRAEFQKVVEINEDEPDALVKKIDGLLLRYGGLEREGQRPWKFKKNFPI